MKFNQAKQYEQPPAGSHLARCIGLVDLGTQKHEFEDKTSFSRDVRIQFELPMEKMLGTYDDESKGKPFGVSRTVKQSLHPKATLRKLVEGWRGKKFSSREEINKFDPKKLLGQPCRVTLVQNGDYMNIDSISPLGKGEKIPKQLNPTTFFSLDPKEFDAKEFDALGDSTKKKVEQSPEYAALGNSEPEGEQQGGEPEGEPESQPESSDTPF